MAEGERSLAVFVDFENLALGLQSPRSGDRAERFDIGRVLERLVEKGKIVAKKAYADWHRFSGFTAALHEAAIELIEIPRRNQTGKNSADIRLCVDAMDLAYSKEHINTFVILSGDSDFSPLVSKLKELGKHVIGLGMQESTSGLLRDNCDEFIYYEDLDRDAPPPDIDSHLPERKRKAFSLLLESLQALRRENKEVLWSSMIKDTMKRKKPSFNETFYGYRTFSELLEDAQHEGLLELETDKRSRTYVVTRFGSEMSHDQPPMLPEPRSEFRSEPRSEPRIVPAVVIPPRPVPSVSGPSASNGGPAGDGPTIPGKKSRRRRRGRGKKDIANGTNGATAASPAASVGAEAFTAGLPEDQEPLPLPAVEQPEPEELPREAAPPPEPIPINKAPEPEPEPLPEKRSEPPVAVIAPPAPPPEETTEAPPAEPAPAAATKPGPRSRTRKTTTPRTTTSRTRKTTETTAKTTKPATAKAKTSRTAKKGKESNPESET